MRYVVDLLAPVHVTLSQQHVQRSLERARALVAGRGGSDAKVRVDAPRFVGSVRIAACEVQLANARQRGRELRFEIVAADATASDLHRNHHVAELRRVRAPAEGCGGACAFDRTRPVAGEPGAPVARPHPGGARAQVDRQRSRPAASRGHLRVPDRAPSWRRKADNHSGCINRREVTRLIDTFRIASEEATRITGETLLQSLERRLDNVVFRMGFASTRAEARQLVSHKAIEVNGEVLACQIVNGQPAVARFSAMNYAKAKALVSSKGVHLMDALSEVGYADSAMMRGLARKTLPA